MHLHPHNLIISLCRSTTLNTSTVPAPCMPTITHLFVSSTLSPCVHHVVRAQGSTALVGRAWTPETAQLQTAQLINVNIDPHQSLQLQTLINKQHIMNMLSHTVGRHLVSAASQCPACNCPRSPRGKGWLSWTLPSWQQSGSPPPSKTAYSGRLSEEGALVILHKIDRIHRRYMP